MERGDLAVAVACHGIGAQPEHVEQAQHRQAGGADRGLGPFGADQHVRLGLLFLVAEDGHGEDDVVQPAAAVHIDGGGLLPHLANGVELDRQIAPHPDILAALAREEEGDLGPFPADAVVQPVRQGNRPVAGLADEIARRRHIGTQRGRIRAQDREAVRRAGIEGCLAGAGDRLGRPLARASPTSVSLAISRSLLSAASSSRWTGSVAMRFACGPRYSSSVTWKLLPPKPNELTAARRGAPAGAIHGRVRVLR